MVATMTINKTTMASQSTSGFTTATELADTMVRVCGIPFRTAHQIVGMLARGSGAPTLSEIDAVAHNVIGESLSSQGLTENMIKEALDPILNVRKRQVIGGPSPREMERALGKRREYIIKDA